MAKPLNYVRPDDLQPNGPNDFDNGTAEPAPPVGDPNGVALEHVTAITPPEVYQAPPDVAPNGVTAKASQSERDAHDAMVRALEEEDEFPRDAPFAPPAPVVPPAPPDPPAVPADPPAPPDPVSEPVA